MCGTLITRAWKLNIIVMDSFTFEKAHLVGTRHKTDNLNLSRLQLPLYVEEGVIMVIQFEDFISKECACSDIPSSFYDAFRKKYHSLDRVELKQACTVQDKDVFSCLSQFVPCVGCRRSVEQMMHQVQQLNNPVFGCIRFTPSGSVVIDPSFLGNPKKLYYLFYHIRTQLFDSVKSLLHNKKNKRCVFHSLKIQKPSETSSENKLNLPKWCNSSILDLWDKMCVECQKEVSSLDMNGILETMEHYLKKHRFCCECKANVMKALNILTCEVDGTDEPGYCSAIYHGLQCCNIMGNDNANDNATKKHIHVCCERPFIVHNLTQADAEMVGGERERHAKTIDIAQEEVCTCLALYLYQRLHRVWHLKLTSEQSWLILLFLGIEAARQNFETCFERKAGFGQMEALCKELEQADKDKESKQQKKRLKRKRQQQRRKDQKGDAPEDTDVEVNAKENSGLQPEAFPGDQASREDNFSRTEFSCLLDLLKQDKQCECSVDEESDQESLPELTKEEILEFERNRSEINAQRTRLRERIRQDFENFCNIAITSTTS